MAPALSTAALIEEDPWDTAELQDTGVKWAGMLNVSLAVIFTDLTKRCTTYSTASYDF